VFKVVAVVQQRKYGVHDTEKCPEIKLGKDEWPVARKCKCFF
ncbi:MAG: hypothetical protein RIS47_1079, partial [Bacteroidota bacterium]